MTKEEAIKYLQQLYPNGGHCWLDEQRIEAIGMAINALQEELASDDLVDASNNYCLTIRKGYPRVKDETDVFICNAFKHGAQWQKERDAKSAENLTRLNSLIDMERTLNAHYKMGIREGKRLQKEQMMKDAVIIEDELVMCYNNGEPTGLSPYKEWWETPEVQNNFKDGDKVKVIIIKD